jgi:hypothetical protein
VTPAGGAVTGEELYEAASAAAPSSHHGNWDWIREDVQAQWNDAAARLSAQTVVDVRRIARELVPDLCFPNGTTFDANVATVERMLRGYVTDAPQSAVPSSVYDAVQSRANWAIAFTDAESVRIVTELRAWLNSVKRGEMAQTVAFAPQYSTKALREAIDAMVATVRQYGRDAYLADHADAIEVAALDLADRRHAAAPATAQVGEVTEEDVSDALNEDEVIEPDAVADFLNTRLRARAGTATPNPGAASSSGVVRWIKRPEGQASALVVPEGGCWMFRWQLWGELGQAYTAAMHYKAGHEVSDTYDAIRRIDTDAPTTWIERTPATAGGWTAETVPSRGSLCVLLYDDGSIVVQVLQESDTIDDAWRARLWNGAGVTAYLAIPPMEAQP